MVVYKVYLTKKALTDIPKLKAARLDQKAKAIISLIEKDPFANPPVFEKLKGELTGLYSRRLNIQHRLVYQVTEEEKAVKILSMRSHYEF